MSLLRGNASTAVSHEVESTHRSTPKSEGCTDESGAEQTDSRAGPICPIISHVPILRQWAYNVERGRKLRAGT